MKNLSKKTKIIIGVVAGILILALIGQFVEDDNTDKATSQDTEKTTKAKTTKKKIESGQYDIDGITFNYTDYVNNDTTGNWRISLIASQEPVTKYALDYYKKMFLFDDEIHAVVNFTTKTTNSITCLGNILDVKVYDYVDKEEHDAKLLFSGSLLKEYHIDVKTGKVKKV